MAKLKCTCVHTLDDIASEASKILGRKVNTHTVRYLRDKLAQAHCTMAFSGKKKNWETGCIRNPYLPTKMFGNVYAFSPARARRLLKAVVTHCSGKKSTSAIRRWRGKTTAFAYA